MGISKINYQGPQNAIAFSAKSPGDRSSRISQEEPQAGTTDGEQ